MSLSTARNSTLAGNTAATGTGSVFVAITASLSGPMANLGGYATAQIIARSHAIGQSKRKAESRSLGLSILL
jgi:hypothetical protein